MEPHTARSVVETRLRERLVELARAQEQSSDCATTWLEAAPYASRASLTRQLIDKLDFRGPGHALGWLGGRVVMSTKAEHDWWTTLAQAARDEVYGDGGLPGPGLEL